MYQWLVSETSSKRPTYAQTAVQVLVQVLLLLAAGGWVHAANQQQRVDFSIFSARDQGAWWAVPTAAINNYILRLIDPSRTAAAVPFRGFVQGANMRIIWYIYHGRCF